MSDSPDAPAEKQVDPAPENPSPIVTGCVCSGAPKIDWKEAEHTFIMPDARFIPSSKQWIHKDMATANNIVSKNLIFKLPLYNGTFLFQPFMKSTALAPIQRAKESSDAKNIWQVDREDPALKRERDVDICGVSEEMMKRLDWAQRRLWYYYCQEKGNATGQPDHAGFQKWLRDDQGIDSHHSTVRSDTSMHGDGAAIDVGASDSPFICVQGLDATDGAEGKIVGEGGHKLPETLTKEQAAEAKFFFLDNAFEPAIMAFNRATLLILGTPAKTKFAPGKFPLALPRDEPCVKTTQHSRYAVDVENAWNNLSAINTAWKTYCSPSTFEEFRTKVLQVAVLKGGLPMDADLVGYADSENTPPPPKNRRLLTEDVAGSKVRKRRKRSQVPLSELQGNGARAREAYFQMLRDRDVVAMAMVKGKLSGVLSNGEAKGKEKRVPCAWPENIDISIPDTRDVTQGFLGISKHVARACAEAGLIWLGGTGDALGNPISGFTGDIMHFDIRTLYQIGSVDLDAWLEGNELRQGWANVIEAIVRRVEEIRKGLAASSFKNCRDVTPLIAKLEKAMGDPASTANSKSAAAFVELGGKEALEHAKALRTILESKRKAFKERTAPSHRDAEAALRKAYFSRTAEEANEALRQVGGLPVSTGESPESFKKSFAAAVAVAEDMTKKLVSSQNKKVREQILKQLEKLDQMVTNLRSEAPGRP